jgi:hypothetical protein
MTKLGIYRAVPKDRQVVGEPYMPRTTMRPPRNVPYIVDNLWEWKRPEKFPNRRFSAFASPKPEFAEQACGRDCRVYQVQINGDHRNLKLCQLVRSDRIQNPRDSKLHPECKSLKRGLIRRLGYEWFHKNFSHKQRLASLWMPCLTKHKKGVTSSFVN